MWRRRAADGSMVENYTRKGAGWRRSCSPLRHRRCEVVSAAAVGWLAVSVKMKLLLPPFFLAAAGALFFQTQPQKELVVKLGDFVTLECKTNEKIKQCAWKIEATGLPDGFLSAGVSERGCCLFLYKNYFMFISSSKLTLVFFSLALDSSESGHRGSGHREQNRLHPHHQQHR